MTSDTKVATSTKKRDSKIQEAYRAVTSTPVTLKSLADRFGLSWRTLRQVNRFNETGVLGITIRKDKESQELLIWIDENKARAEALKASQTTSTVVEVESDNDVDQVDTSSMSTRTSVFDMPSTVDTDMSDERDAV